MIDTIDTLWRWTPFLAGGFVFNVLISIVSMLLGTLLGGALGWARSSHRRTLRVGGHLPTTLCRNVPSFVLMFYVAFIIPVEFSWNDTIATVPLWIKATLALTIPVIGFASDQTVAYVRQTRAGLDSAVATFISAWVQYFLIIVMASATASVIGVDEIVGRANTIIATDQRPEFLIATYVYVAVWFLLAARLLTVVTTGLAKIHARGSGGRPNAASSSKA